MIRCGLELEKVPPPHPIKKHLLLSEVEIGAGKDREVQTPLTGPARKLVNLSTFSSIHCNLDILLPAV